MTGREVLTIRLTPVERGWWMAQVVERPAAISQGRTPRSACVNVLDALNELEDAA